MKRENQIQFRVGDGICAVRKKMWSQILCVWSRIVLGGIFEGIRDLHSLMHAFSPSMREGHPNFCLSVAIVLLTITSSPGSDGTSDGCAYVSHDESVNQGDENLNGG